MTREQLEELIKQKGTVYCPMNFNGLIVEYDLSLFECKFASDDEKVFACIFNAEHEGGCYCLRDIFKTREQALWSAKIRAKRIEIFDPPMWEDIKDEFVFKFLVDGCLFRFYVDKDFCDIFGQLDGDDCYLVSKPATKENYEKACEVVRELFNKRGEK